MNILASWNWLGEWVDLKGLTPEAVAARVSLSGPGIEKIISQEEALSGIVLGQILTIQPHPQADRLRVTEVNVGSEMLHIVCGGSNLEVGQWVPVAKIGSWVRWHGEGESVELKPTEIRGVASEGMICAANEIGLAEAFPHGEKEIMDVGRAFPEKVVTFVAGQSLAQALGLAGDVLLDAEVTTNRPDAMGMEGFAREVAAILDRSYQVREGRETEGSEPAPIVALPPAKKGKNALCPRFCAVKIDGLKIGASPWWMKQRLLAAGLRPINTVVDITNYVLLEMAQPLHAYDATKLQGTLSVGLASEGESFAALNGKTYALKQTMLTVRDEAGPVAIAGVIGGERTAVTEQTTSIVFEAAAFDEVSIRRTSRGLDVMTDASKLFERGLSVEAPRRALARAVELCLQLTGGKVASQITDVRLAAYEPETFTLSEKEACRLMGISLSGDEMQAILERLGFQVVRAPGKLKVTVPWWRDHDIEDARDLVEEMARVYGYANMTPVFPAGMSPVPSDPAYAFADRLRDLAKGFGFTELMSYSMLSREQLERVQMPMDLCVRLLNPLVQDQEYMRPSLGPSVLQALVDNQERASELRLFELSQVYWHQPDISPLPQTRAEFVMAIATKDAEPWAEAKGIVEALVQELGIAGGAWQRWTGDYFWHPGRALQYVVSGKPLFTVGELHPHMAEAWKIERRVGLVQAFVEDVWPVVAATKRYQPIALFPEVERDLAFTVAETVEVAQLEEAMFAAGTTSFLVGVRWFDTFRGASLETGKKSLAFHLIFRASDRTLSSTEVDAALEQIRHALEKTLGAQFRG